MPKSSNPAQKTIVFIFWILAFTATILWARTDGPMWDLHIYGRALHAVAGGQDPYAAGIAIQEAYHTRHVLPAGMSAPPYTYVYSPITLPALRVIAHFSSAARHWVYWVLYVVCVLTMIGVGMQAVAPEERKYLGYFAPAAAFFPGLLVHDVILSGNIVYIVYGVILAAMWLGEKRGKWGWYYVVVLLASCCKAPLLTLLAIPVLSARKQWLKAMGTGALGVGLFLIQPHIWPGLFRSFMRAVDLQFLYNSDFGLSPAGKLGEALQKSGHAFSTASWMFYLLYGSVVLGVMLVLSRGYKDGTYTLEQWWPVVMIGTILLNPRVMTYDTAPLTVPMAIVLWRVVSHVMRRKAWAVAVTLAVFIGLNAMVLTVGTQDFWKDVECVLMVAAFVAGCVDLIRSGSSGGEAVSA